MTFTERVMAYFRERPNVWIRAESFELVGGRQAWRSRIADARVRFQAEGAGTIENRCTTIREHLQTCPGLQAWDVPGACNCGRPRRWTLSEYRFVPAVRQPQADANGQIALI